MKTDIHPKYFPKASVKCACGNSFTVGSTKEFIETEICAQCHPFYTGTEKVLDTLGRVQKFKDRASKKQAPKTKKVRVKKEEEKK
jgi:large subunit ribosomal protein L31